VRVEHLAATLMNIIVFLDVTPCILVVTYQVTWNDISEDHLSAALVDLDHFFSFLIYRQSVGLFGLGMSTLQGYYLHTEQHKHRKNAHRYPCLEWDSNL
jgi:hypothetical protein